jgi:uncharacterized protein (TIGR03790 family)
MINPIPSPFSLLAALCLLCVSADGLRAQAQEQSPLGVEQAVDSSVYAPSTLVLYNKNVAESRDLAVVYVHARGLSPDLVIPLDCPDKETITREEYTKTIEEPLKMLFDERKWWTLESVAGGRTAATANKIKVIALMFGMPLRIEPTPTPPTGEVDAEGKPVPPPPDYQNSDGASIDSELSVLGFIDHETKGFAQNPYFRAGRPFEKAALGGFMLVGRIDGPDFATAKRLITDAIEVEKTGLWGFAYIDLARMEIVKGKGYEEGDIRLRNVANMYKAAGIPAIVDSQVERFPPHYPMGDNTIFYFGWYVYHSDGPFREGDFKFKKGAVAAHLHSFSATSLRSTTDYWVGPLLHRGAAAVLGTVYEPFLSLTTQYDVFHAFLLEGYSFVEAGWLASPAVSWMNIMVGDPLYQPFKKNAQIPRTPDADFKAFKVGVARWGAELQRAELVEKLGGAGEKLKSGPLLEALGLRLWQDLKTTEAAPWFEKAKSLYPEKRDQLRMDLHLAAMLREDGKKPEAVAAFRKAAETYKNIPEHAAAQALADQLDPPPPPPPPKP